ncbi:MAG: acyl-CoA synthetase [Chromatiales bacterium]|nr:acyl-CoA synthetase [Chromatiales bacterium]
MATYHPSNHALATPDRPAYIMADSGKSVSFGQLDRQANQFSHVFRSLGLQRGAGIAMLMENAPGFLEVCWASQRSGLHFTPISTHLKASEIGYIIADCGAQAFLVSSRYADAAQSLAELLGDDTILLSIGGDIPGYQPLETLADKQPEAPIADRAPGVTMLYSSGTTGYPKGVRRSLAETPFDDIPLRLGSMAERYGFDESSVYLCPAPLYHAAPLGYTMAVMGFGGTCIVMQRFDAEAALAAIELFKITHSQWVPTMFIRMLRLDASVREQYDLRTHKVAIHAAAPCPVETKAAMIEWWGPMIYEYYGGSEGVGSTFITADEWLRKPGSVGRTIGGKLRIVMEDGREANRGDIGTVYFEDAPAFEYHNAPEKTADAFNQRGWGTYGDVGYLDEDDYLFLTDRKANMIISGGVNIYPQEAENLLLGHPAVVDAAVFGVPNADFGEEVKAVIQPVPGIAADVTLEQDLIAYCKEQLADIKCPRSVDFEETLPRLANGKLYKRELKARYWPDQHSS